LVTRGEAEAANFDEKSDQILNTIRTAVEENVSLIQIREKALPAHLLFELTVEAAKITRGTATRLLVNDRADIALAAGADGVHLTTNSLRCDIVRRAFPSDFIIGQSAHTIEEVTQAACDGANFVVFGPIYETPGKNVAQGTDVLSAVCKTADPFPILAIGGIDDTNISSVLDAGAAGFAAIRVLNDPDALRSISRRYRNVQTAKH